MDVEHGLGNVTGEIMLATRLNHWVKCYGKADIVRTDPEGAFRDQGFRHCLAAKSIRLVILGKRPGKQEFLGKPPCIETVDSLRGSCCWDKHRQTKQLVNILIWPSANLNWWTKLRNSASV